MNCDVLENLQDNASDPCNEQQSEATQANTIDRST